MNSLMALCNYKQMCHLKNSQPDLILVSADNAQRFYTHFQNRRKNYEFITLCRNPYDRFVSGWAFCKNHNWIDHDLDYLTSIDNPDSLKEYRKKYKIGFHHIFRPQAESLLFKGKLAVDRVIRFEHLQKDYSDLLCDFNYPDKKLLHRNKSKHKPWQEYYDKNPKLKSFVKRTFANDFKAIKLIASIECTESNRLSIKAPGLQPRCFPQN